MHVRSVVVAMAAVVLTACGCAAPAAAATARPLPVDGRFDYQIGGAYTPAGAVVVVDRDRTAAPVRGKYNVCYVNAFQTQPGELAGWRRDHPTALLHTSSGKLVADPGWPDEYLLDTSTPARRAEVLAVVGKWIDGCAAAGYQAVEPDNLDSWTRSGGRLSKAGNVAMATLLAARAHRAGLAIAQKNTPELGRAGRTSVGFDFAIAEECQVYDECGDYTSVYGRAVVEIEYTDEGTRPYQQACAARGASISVVLRDRDVVPKGSAAYRYQSC